MCARAATSACACSAPAVSGTASRPGSSRTPPKPLASAHSICRAVTGEQLPETTATRSAGGAGGSGSGSGSNPADRQWATSAYSTPEEPAMNCGAAAWRQIWRPTSASDASSSTSNTTTSGRAASAAATRASTSAAASSRISTRAMVLPVCRTRWRRRSASVIGVTGWCAMVGCRSSRWVAPSTGREQVAEHGIAAQRRRADDQRYDRRAEPPVARPGTEASADR